MTHVKDHKKLKQSTPYSLCSKTQNPFPNDIRIYKQLFSAIQWEDMFEFNDVYCKYCFATTSIELFCDAIEL